MDLGAVRSDALLAVNLVQEERTHERNRDRVLELP